MSKQQNLHWEEYELYHDREPVMRIEPHLIHPGMFYVVWPDGVKSQDFYRIEYAKEHCLIEAGKMMRGRATDAFK